jgi:superoxide dismutase
MVISAQLHYSLSTVFDFTGKLDELISRDFGSLEELKKKMNAAAAGIQGSGWAWLVRFTILHLLSYFRY